MSRFSLHRVARLSTFAAALIVGVTFAAPSGPAFAEGVRGVRENGLVVTPAKIGSSYFSTLSARNPDTIQFQNGTLVEIWKIQGQRGQCVDISMRSEAFDSMLDLFAVHPTTGELELVGRNDDGGDGLDARLQGRLPVTGSYYIVASSASGEDPDARYDLAIAPC